MTTRGELCGVDPEGRVNFAGRDMRKPDIPLASKCDCGRKISRSQMWTLGEGLNKTPRSPD